MAREPFNLIYREYCLAEADGRTPDPESFVGASPDTPNPCGGCCASTSHARRR